MGKWLAAGLGIWSAVAIAGTPEELVVRAGGLDRWTTVYTPGHLESGAAAVLLLHGGGQSMRKILARNSGGTVHWLQLADREKFLLLVPNASNANDGDPNGDKQNWNDYRPSTARAKSGADDVTFLIALLDWAKEKYRIDPRRVYVTGASNGGMMTMRLIAEHPERFAAAAAFVASLPVQPPPPSIDRPVPLLLFNGTKDPLIQWNGGMIAGQRGETMAIEPMVAWWQRVNRIDRAAGKRVDLPDRDPHDGCRLQRTDWPARAGGAPLVFVQANGGGHALPSIEHPVRKGPLIQRLIGPVCHDVEGAEMAWEFMKSHRR